jgi:glycosyltransferase involved in cell wall biosynthesis
VRIAQIAPLMESVPPKLYGGTERVVSYLTEELAALGHEVTLYASGDSLTRAELRATTPDSLRLNPACVDPLAHHIAMVEQVARDAADFDMLHFHLDYLHFPLTSRYVWPHVTTLHGRLDIPDLPVIHRTYRRMPVVSISNSQRKPLPWLNWRGTIYHGLPSSLYSFQEKSGQDLIFLGRISPEKGAHLAIRIAERAGRRLRIAAKVDTADREYFEQVIRPMIRSRNVEFIGEIGEGEKQEFLGDAAALLLPVTWPEPFGLVMIEALACGTPVIAYNAGSVPELIADGSTGFVVRDEAAAVGAVNRIQEISRHNCRKEFERRFTATRMAHEYLGIFRALSGDTSAPESTEGKIHAGHDPDRGKVLPSRDIRAR